MSDQESSGVLVDESEPPASSVQETSAEKPIANDDDDELDALLDGQWYLWFQFCLVNMIYDLFK